MRKNLTISEHQKRVWNEFRIQPLYFLPEGSGLKIENAFYLESPKDVTYGFRIIFWKLVKIEASKSEILIKNIDFYNGVKPNQEVEVVKNAKCPDCDAELEIPEDVMQGEILSCPSCGLELEVKKIKGESVELQELGIEGEDWGE